MKKIITIFLLLLLCNITVVPCEAKIHKGRTKKGVTYQYDTKNKTLTLSGKNVKGNWSKQQRMGKKNPWDKWQDKAKKIVLKKGVETVTHAAFESFAKVKTVVFPKTIKKIGEYAFSDTQIKKLALPNSVTEIGWGAFAADMIRGSIKEVKLSSKLRKIHALAFSDQSSLTKIIIPQNVTSIGYAAFENCSELRTVIIKSKKIKEIGERAFSGLAANAVIYIPKDKEKEYRRILWEFDGVNGLKIKVFPSK